MSVVKVSGNVSGSGILTIAAPATNTDRTLTLPDQTGTVLTNAGPFTANASASAGAVTIDASNNVGIGVTPSAWDSTFVAAQIGAATTTNGNAALYSQKNGGFSAGLLTNTYYSSGWKYVTSNPATKYEQNTGSSAYFAWYTAPSGTAGNAITFTQAMTLDSNGNLLIGTTTSSGNNGIVAAGVYNNTTASGANVQVDNTGPGLLRRSTSSIQYKTQVENIAPEFIDNVLKFRPVWYRSLCEGDRKDWSWYGLIAEEVAELDPRLVHWRQYDTSVDADGNTVQTKLDQPVAEGVMYDRVVVLALAKIQEQQATIESLTARIVALEAK